MAHSICARSLRRVVVALFALSFVMPVLAFAQAKMHTPGQFDVSQSGAATYTIPLEAPPGTAGMQPSLTLDYSSQTSNGFVGHGWSMGGLSVLHRCGSTIATDNVRGGISYTATDRFCLDGQRLVVVNGLANGAANAEYRTERDSFTKVVAVGDSNGACGGTCYFIAYTKSGQIFEYGATPDSRILPVFPTGVTVTTAQRASPRVWAVSRIRDRAGNYMTFSYATDTVAGAYYPSRIDYTGNMTAGTATYASVRFGYVTRPDTTAQFIGQAQVQYTTRLTQITTYVGETTVKQYRLGYENTSTTGRSLVSRVQEFSADGTKWLPATTFEYQLGGGGVVNPSPGTVNLEQLSNVEYGVMAGDFNGDGVSDLIRTHYTGTMYFCPGPQISASVTGCTNIGSLPSNTSTVAGDFDNDGITDLYLINLDAKFCPKPGINGLASCTLTGYSPVGVENASRIRRIGVGDFNGDGYTDLVFLGRPTAGMWDISICYGRSDGSGIRPSNGPTSLDPSAPPRCPTTQIAGDWYTFNINYQALTMPIADYDGDGSDDLYFSYYQSVQTSQASVFVNKASYGCIRGSACSTTTLQLAGQSVLVPQDKFADFNGDGYIDIIRHPSASGYTWSNWSFCPGPMTIANPRCVTMPALLGAVQDQISVLPSDLNGDGVTDLFIMTDNGSEYFCAGPTLLSVNNCQARTANGWYGHNVMAGDFNGDGIQDLMHSNQWLVFLSGGTQLPDVLSRVTSGLGAYTRIDYAPINAASGVYSKGSGAARPVQEFAGPMYVVNNTWASNGVGGEFVKTHRYQGARVNLQGRGFLGFASIDGYSNLSSVWERVRRTNYSQTFPCTGSPALVEELAYSTLTAGYVAVKSTSTALTSSNTLGAATQCYATSNTETTRELNNVVQTTTTTTYSAPDAYGNVSDITVSSSDGFTKTTKHAYNNDTTNWILGRLSCSVVSSATPWGVFTRTSAFDYTPLGFLWHEVVEPGTACQGVLPSTSNAAQERLTTTHGYDAFGNKTSVQVTSSAATTDLWFFAPRTTTTTYDAQGRFITSVKNSLNQTETHAYDYRWGKQTSLTGPNALTTAWYYDEFGRKTGEGRADGTSSAWGYVYCDVGQCGQGYRITQTGTGVPYAMQYFDILDREWRTRRQGAAGKEIVVDTGYNAFGQVQWKSRPFYDLDPVSGTTYLYDVLDRPTQETRSPDNAVTTYAYNGLATLITNPEGQRTCRVVDSQGQLRHVKNNTPDTTPNASTCVLASAAADVSGITYTYDPFGNIKTTTDSKGNVITMTYNTRGHKIGMVDPDMGNWGYAYNALGELVEQSDPVQRAKAQATTKIYYDNLGRMRQRVEPDLTGNWYYDTYASGAACNKGIGKLCEVVATGTATFGGSGTRRVYTYDGFGRESNVANYIDSTTTPYDITTAYDSASRVSTITYPSVTISSVASRFAVKHLYNAAGYLSEIRDNVSNTLYWQGNTWDADLNVTKETVANGLTTNCRTYDAAMGHMTGVSGYLGDCRTISNTSTGTALHVQGFNYDKLGNLRGRVDNMQVPALNEVFGYDRLNRLTGVTMSGTTALTRSYQYDSIGNLTYRSEIGALNYAGAAGGVRPHALTSATGTVRAIVNPLYTYDANGNQLTGLSNTRAVSYFSFNMPNRINSSSSLTDFLYDADHNRIREVNASGTLVFVNPGNQTFFEKNTAGTLITYRHFIHGPSGVIAVWKRTSAAVNEMRYMHKDHLGSITVESSINGTVLARNSYDAWGKPRNANGTDLATNPALGTRRGFTGHEHMPETGGLIHMNGRVYDPWVGRMMTADTFIQFDENSQSYNRYTYVLNNPLSFTDPTGHFLPVIAAIIGTIAAEVAISAGATTILAGAIGGAFAGAVAGEGDPRAILQGAVSGALFGFAHEQFGTKLPNGKIASPAFNSPKFWGKVATHAVGGGAINAAFGGSFRGGALSAGFAAFGGGALEGSGWQIDSAKYVVARVVMGGIGAELGGDKFANGAVTAAFAYVMNECGATRSCGNGGYDPSERRPLDPAKYLNEPSLETDVAITIPSEGKMLWVPEGIAPDAVTAVQFGWDRLPSNHRTDCLVQCIGTDVVTGEVGQKTVEGAGKTAQRSSNATARSTGTWVLRGATAYKWYDRLIGTPKTIRDCANKC